MISATVQRLSKTPDLRFFTSFCKNVNAQAPREMVNYGPIMRIRDWGSGNGDGGFHPGNLGIFEIWGFHPWDCRFYRIWGCLFREFGIFIPRDFLAMEIFIRWMGYPMKKPPLLGLPKALRAQALFHSFGRISNRKK